jgi:hypothetical protein
MEGSSPRTAGAPDGLARRPSGALAHRAGAVLSLGAAPVFALLAVLTAVQGSGPGDSLCSAMPGAAPHGMALMYGLMSVFHVAPWLRLLPGDECALDRPSMTRPSDSGTSR